MTAPRPDPTTLPHADPAVADTPTAAPRAASFPFLSPPELPDEIGRLGPYRVLGELGRGGMGVVFRAEDAHLKRHVALKVMLPPSAASPDTARRFLREARAQARVEHDHVVAIHQVGEENGVPFLAMPLLRGHTLAAALRAAPRPPAAEVVRIGREMAAGLAAAHDRGLVHRDVKPGNVWLEGDARRVKILDFGLARLEDEAASTDSGPVTVEGAILGTPQYMSPEQARGGPVDARTDLFSLGVVLYEMCAGGRPFGGATVTAALAALAADDPRPLADVRPDLPARLTALVMRLLEKDPARRPASAAEVAAALDRIEQGMPDPPAADGTRDRPRRRRRKKRGSRLPLVLAGVGGMVLAGLLAVIGALVLNRDPGPNRLPELPDIVPKQTASGNETVMKPWEAVRPDWWPAAAPPPPWWEPGMPFPSRRPEWWQPGMGVPPPPRGWKEGDEWPSVEGRPPPPPADAGRKPVKVFLLAGESNMAGKGHVRTLDWLGKDPKYGWLLGRLKNPDGKGWAARDDVWVFSHNREESNARGGKFGSLGIGFGAGKDQIGPELVFGHVMGDHFDNQVLLVKVTQGGLSLAVEGRPPSSGGPAGEYFRTVHDVLRQALDRLPVYFPAYADRGFELAGFVWFHGWNDSINPAYATQYEENLVNLIRDVRKDLAKPNLPVVVGEMGIDGDAPMPGVAAIRKAQAAAAARPEFAGTVALARTADLWDTEAAALLKKGWDPVSRKWDPEVKKEFEVMGNDEAYHYMGSAKMMALVGLRMGEAMKALLPK